MSMIDSHYKTIAGKEAGWMRATTYVRHSTKFDPEIRDQFTDLVVLALTKPSFPRTYLPIKEIEVHLENGEQGEALGVTLYFDIGHNAASIVVSPNSIEFFRTYRNRDTGHHEIQRYSDVSPEAIIDYLTYYLAHPDFAMP